MKHSSILGLVALFGGSVVGCTNSSEDNSDGTGSSCSGSSCKDGGSDPSSGGASAPGGGSAGEFGGKSGAGGSGSSSVTKPSKITIGHFNIRELTTDKLLDENDEQATAAAEIIGRFNPDIMEINELQFDIENIPHTGNPGMPKADAKAPTFNAGESNASRLGDRAGKTNSDAVWDYSVVTLGNSGLYWSGDNPSNADEFVLRGWGEFKGRFNTGLLSRYPILTDEIRVINDFKWKDLPDNHIADLEANEGIEVPDDFPLFEKSLNIIPVDIAGTKLYFVLIHTVAPGWDRIGSYRNFDELHGVELFLSGELPGVDPLPDDARFIIMGDLNSDSDEEEGSDSLPGAIQQLANHPKVAAWYPSGNGTKGKNGAHNSYCSGCGHDDGTMVSDPTKAWQMQLDYMLPSETLGKPASGKIFWPDPKTEKADWELSCRASDHKMLFEEYAWK